MMDDNTPFIQFKDVSYRYDKQASPVIRDIQLIIQRGDFVALIGQNGAGKTTAAKHINGILKPSSGQVLIEGRSTASYSRHEIARTIGYCYQNPDHQIFSTTVENEVEYGARALGYDSAKVKQQAELAMDLVGLTARRKNHPSMLGRGERQRLAVASILAMGVSTLVVDEPTTGLDYAGVVRIMDLLASWNQTLNTTIVIITHDIPIVADYVPRTVLMGQGHILMDDSTGQVLQAFDLLRSASVRPPQVTRVAQKLNLLTDAVPMVTVSAFMSAFTQKLNENAFLAKEG